MAEEVEWYDVLVRRPDDTTAHKRAKERKLPAPTELLTSTYPQAGRDGEDIKLVFKGYSKDSEEAMISSGLTQWRASDVLCNYLLNTDDIDIKNSYINVGLHLLELGSGSGKCGLLAHHLLQAKFIIHSTVLTDGDVNAMRLLQRNVAFNTDDEIISCQQLRWGEEEAKAFISQQHFDTYPHHFNLTIGSDLLQTSDIHHDHTMEALFVTVKTIGCTFILSHDEERSVPVDSVIASAARKLLFCEVLKQEGSVYLLRFKRTKALRVNRMASRLQATITDLESRIRALEIDKKYAEDKILKLDERCTVLRGNNDLPKSILLSFEKIALLVYYHSWSHKTLLNWHQPVNVSVPRHIK